MQTISVLPHQRSWRGPKVGVKVSRSAVAGEMPQVSSCSATSPSLSNTYVVLPTHHSMYTPKECPYEYRHCSTKQYCTVVVQYNHATRSSLSNTCVGLPTLHGTCTPKECPYEYRASITQQRNGTVQWSYNTVQYNHATRLSLLNTFAALPTVQGARITEFSR